MTRVAKRQKRELAHLACLFSQKYKVVFGPIYTVRFLSHATSSRQAYDMTYDSRSVLKHVFKCHDIFSGVHVNRKSCRGPVASLSHTTKIVPCKSALRRLQAGTKQARECSEGFMHRPCRYLGSPLPLLQMKPFVLSIITVSLIFSLIR